MRLALSVGPGLWLEPDGVQRTGELVRQAESIGFASVWASEDPDGWDAFSALTLLAQHSSLITLGSGVTNPYFRHPNLIAASMATLDRASAGRSFLGLGRGEPDWYRAAFGMDIGSPLARVEETISLLRQWWGPEKTANMTGEFTVRDWRRTLGPFGVPPIYVAATGPQMARLAGRAADGMRINGLSSLVAIGRGITAAREARVSVNREWSGFRVTAEPSLTITRSSAEIEGVLERNKSFIARIHVLPGMHQLLAGLENEFDIERILAGVRQEMNTTEILQRGGSFADLRAGGDLNAARKVIPVELVDRLAVVGPVERVLPRLREYAEAGVTDIFARPSDMVDPELVAKIASL